MTQVRRNQQDREYCSQPVQGNNTDQALGGKIKRCQRFLEFIPSRVGHDKAADHKECGDALLADKPGKVLKWMYRKWMTDDYGECVIKHHEERSNCAKSLQLVDLAH